MGTTARPRGLLAQMGHYSLASLAVMAASLISYPILTRVLRVSEYGYMGLIVVLLNLLVGLGKLGFQFSIVRLWPEQVRQPGGKQRFILTMFVGMAGLASAVLLLYVGATLVLSPLLGADLTLFILLSSPLLLTRTATSFGTSLLRARQRSATCATFEVLTTYTAMLLAVLGATTVVGGLTGFYLGLTTGEILVTAALVLLVLRQTRWRRSNLDPGLLRRAAAFGCPMALSELSCVLFATGDRFVILALLDETALGYYAVAHNLATYVELLFAESVNRAAMPIYTELYESAGIDATRAFLGKAARWYFLFALPAIAGMTVIREDLIVLLASKKFLPGVDLVHILLAAFLCFGSTGILGAGLFLKKRPWRMAQLNFGAALVNVALNLALIPLFGLRGAALATLTTQLGLTAMLWRLGSRLVNPGLDVGALLRHGACAVLMGLIVRGVYLEPCALRLALRILVGCGSYVGLLLLLDADARGLARRVLRRGGVAE